MKFDQLLYFREAARHQHLAKASRSLNISISSISHAIRALEATLGCKLFEKRGKSIYLTSKGRLLAERTEELFQHVEDIKTSVQSDTVQWRGRFRAGVTPGLDAVLVLPCWSRFQRPFPELVLDYSSHRSSNVVDLVAKGELDFGICYDPVASPLVSSTVIMREPHLLTVRRNHDVLKSKRLGIHHLVEYPCCSPKMYPGIEICKQPLILRNHGIQAKIDFEFDTYIVAVHRLLTTDSWCYLPSSFARKFGLKQIPLSGFGSEVTLKAVWPSSRPLAKPIEVFIQKLVCDNQRR